MLVLVFSNSTVFLEFSGVGLLWEEKPVKPRLVSARPVDFGVVVD